MRTHGLRTIAHAWTIAVLILAGRMETRSETPRRSTTVDLQNQNGKCGLPRVSLNGKWQAGMDRKYEQVAQVPGMIPATPTEKPSSGVTWYKRDVGLPQGDWLYATMVLKGANFAPAVYVNGVEVSRIEGGMTPSIHLLKSGDVAPGKTLSVEVALKSMNDIPENDPSYIPKADHKRCNLASWIWDDVEIVTHRRFYLERIVPVADMDKGELTVRWKAIDYGNGKAVPDNIKIEILGADGTTLVSADDKPAALEGKCTLRYGDTCKPWSPSAPNLYKIRVTVSDHTGQVSHQEVYNWAPRRLGLKKYDFGTGLHLNGQPVSLRGAGIVWRRWTRDSESQAVMNDRTWFLNNLLKPFKDRGGNFIRLHLYLTPEFILDMCDELGIMVDSEWHFFHEYTVDENALKRQWRAWFDLAQRHPCIVAMQPYNESSGPMIATTMKVAEELESEYQPTLMFDRDILDVHLYWWSVFGNLGLYYDSPAFSGDKALLLGEIGANYLDGNYNKGGYWALGGSFQRFLGANHNATDRKWLLEVSNGKIGEYWRRLNTPGISAFCILGSFADGCHWYEGKLIEGKLKSVWDRMTPVWSARSASLEIWHRNFVPGQKVTAPLHLFNETGETAELKTALRIRNTGGDTISETIASRSLAPFGHTIENVSFEMPATNGHYIIEAHLLNPTPDVVVPVLSQWDAFVSTAQPDTELQKAVIGVLSEEKELIEFLGSLSIKTVDITDAGANALLGSLATWKKLAGSGVFRRQLESAVSAGKGLVLLDAGPRVLEMHYPGEEAARYGFSVKSRADNEALSFAEAYYATQQQLDKTVPFLFGCDVGFSSKSKSGADSCVHPAANGAFLWQGLDRMQTWLWNGLRGGINVPSVKMDLVLNRKAFLEQWKRRGANITSLKDGKPVIAFSLADNFVYSDNADDKGAIDKLKQKVAILKADAPAIAGTIQEQELQVVDLAAKYATLGQSQLQSEELAVNGTGLYNACVVRVRHPKANIIVSQLITAWRLGGEPSSPKPYAACRDEAARQMVLNMLSGVL